MPRLQIAHALVIALAVASAAPTDMAGDRLTSTGASSTVGAHAPPDPQGAGGGGVGPGVTEAVTGYAVGSGAVQKAGTNTWVQIQDGMKFSQGDQIRTGPGDNVELHLQDGSQIRLSPNASLTIETAQQDLLHFSWVVHQQSGSGHTGRIGYWVSVGTDFKVRWGAYDATCRNCVIGVRGTRFEAVLDPDDTLHVRTFEGAVDVTNAGRTISLAAGSETTVPPGQAPVASKAFNLAVACDSVALPKSTVYLPNVTKTLGGPGGWVTPFIVQNIGTVSTNIEVTFYRFADGGLVTCRKATGLLPFTSFADVPNNDEDLPGNTQFSVVVQSFGAPIIGVVNEHQGLDNPVRAEALSYQGLSSGARQVFLPYVAKWVNGWLTTFILQNLGSEPANVNIAFAGADGLSDSNLTRQIGPGRSGFVNPAVESALATGIEYAVTLTSDQPIGVVINAHNDAPEVAAPKGFSYNGIADATAGNVYVPLVSRNSDGIGRTSRLLVQNAGTADATPKLTFTRFGGASPVTITAPKPIRQGRAWSFDARFDASGAACPPTGSASCLGDGEWAATVSGGVFAVADAIVSDATAMGFGGQLAAGNRVYMPNVTRTLGGSSGWTTPILLQSAGATNATLRWYRFADGQLVLRQPISGLTPGAAVRVDPRKVDGLADDTQYAVVADAQGGDLVAVVTELSFSGGDGAMSYDGFAARVDPVPAPTALSLSPATGSVNASGTVQMSALVKDQFDNFLANQPVSWKIDPPTMGTISASGIFTAGPEWGQATVTAALGQLSASAPVVIRDAAGRDPSAFAMFDRKVLAFMRAGNVPGASLAVIKDGRLVYIKGYGVADIASRKAATTDSLFRIASISKSLTGTATLRLVQDGKLSLDTQIFDVLNVQPFLPGGTAMDPRIRSITVRQLLEHSGGWDFAKSGNPPLWNVASAMGVPSPPTLAQYVSWVFGRKLDFDPGTQYVYSGIGYNVLSLVIEKASGMSYENYVRSVLARIGITRTRVGDARVSRTGEGEVTYYPVDGTTYPSLYSQDQGRFVSLAYGAAYAIDSDQQASSGWVSSAADLARVITALRTRDTRLLSSDSFTQLFARPSLPLWPTGYYWYAKGWGVTSVGTSVYFGHTGLMPGTSAIAWSRADGSGWAILLNKDAGLSDSSVNESQLNADLNAAANAISSWPSWDLFPEHP